MKTARFLILIFSIFIILFSYLPAVALAKAGPPIALSSYTVSAYVPEHLTYIVLDDKITITTNCSFGYNLIYQAQNSIIIVSNF